MIDTMDPTQPRLHILLILLCSSLMALAQSPPEVVFEPLWEDGAPDSNGSQAGDTPSIYALSKPDNPSGAAVIVCPGGGYWIHAMDHEGLQVAQWLRDNGVQAFILKYRLRSNGYDPSLAFEDGKRALRWVRAQQSRWGLDPERVGLLGFSAGGHLASAIGIDHDRGDPNAQDVVERASCKPNFLILGYSAMAGDYRPEELTFASKPVTASTPPSFIFHTDRDGGVLPTWATRFYNDLRAAEVDAELHIFGGYGPHGVGLAPGDPAMETWPDLAVRWMRKMGFLSASPRVSVQGHISVDGRPLHRGWITFTPIDSSHDPIAGLYIPHANEGSFHFDTQTGPTAGPHWVTIHRLADALDPEPSIPEATVYDTDPKTGARLMIDVVPNADPIDFSL